MRGQAIRNADAEVGYFLHFGCCALTDCRLIEGLEKLAERQALTEKDLVLNDAPIEEFARKVALCQVDSQPVSSQLSVCLAENVPS